MSRSTPAKRIVNTALPRLIAPVLRAVGATWSIDLKDHANLTNPAVEVPPLIWVLWHNRLLIVPILYQRYFRHRKGAALISQSKDGEILAGCIERFGGETVRGSTSRGGSAAAATLRRKMSDGYDIYITPDGPRGPRYSMSAGAVWLAQSAEVEILPLAAEASRCWRLGRWDGFIIPKPFAKIEVTLGPLHKCHGEGAADLDAERESLRHLMLQGTKTR
jgi:lysophospholipid acyltransferase (LPLAT)-like uncharacterized protein